MNYELWIKIPIFAPMKSRFVYIIILLGAIFSLSACSDSIDFPDLDTYESVAIVYWMGDNSLSTSYDNVQADINELVAGKNNIPANSKIIIYADKQNVLPVIYQLDAQNGLQVWKQFTVEEDCTDSLTMLTNLKNIIQAFPAKKYGLIFGAHGTGMEIRERQHRAIGKDVSHNGNWMNLPTLRGVLEQLPHMSYIFFDVCFMQSIEVAYELRKEADWIIGSPAEIPGPGAPYHILTKALCEGDVFGIVEGYDGYYPSNGYEGTLLSVIKCNELESLAAATNVYIKEAFAERQTISSTQAGKIQKYSSQFSAFTYCYDIKSAMANILSSEDFSLWEEAYENAVPLHKYNSGRWTSSWYTFSERLCNNPTIYDSEHFGGVSMYIPQEGSEGEIKNSNLRQYQWYKDAGWSETGW
jgi:hypothetical protein